ncbi:MAG: Ig-like domain-containing protein [Chloroflexota bacterium]
MKRPVKFVLIAALLLMVTVAPALAQDGGPMNTITVLGSGSASGEFAGDLFIESCSLGCNDGTGGQAVFCGVINVTENQEISVRFSEPVSAASLTSTTFRVTDVANGTSPEGIRFVDPIDPRRVVFRPALLVETGGVDFAFERNGSYRIEIPGTAQGAIGPRGHE